MLKILEHVAFIKSYEQEPNESASDKNDQLSAAAEKCIEAESDSSSTIDLQSNQYMGSNSSDFSSFEMCITHHLRTSGMYWGLNALSLMKNGKHLNRNIIINHLKNSRLRNGSFGGNAGYDGSLQHSLSAIQLLILIDATNLFNLSKTAEYVANLQMPNGSFKNDPWTDTEDTRFVYCAVAALALLKQLDRIDVKKVISYIGLCQNWDGAFGMHPNAESHAGQTFCCLATLSILNAIDQVVGQSREKLKCWLLERQLETGGLNGRPNKAHDACYSWWTLASLKLLSGSLSGINVQSAINFLICNQNASTGGFSPRPTERADVFHTHFAIAGLSLLEHPDLEEVDARFCLPKSFVHNI